MVGASSLLAGLTYHLQESDAELQVRLWSAPPPSRRGCVRLVLQRRRRTDSSISIVFSHVQYSAWILSPLAVFILVEAATLSAAFFILLPQTMAQAYRDDKTSAFKVADSAVLSALPPAVARFAVGSGIAWRRAALAVVRDGALFMTLYLLCVSKLFGGEDDVDLELGAGIGADDTEEGWQEMDGGISVHSYTIAAEDD